MVTSKTFKTEEEFRDWLRKQKLTAEPRHGTGLFKNGDRVGSYFETDEGIEVDLGPYQQAQIVAMITNIQGIGGVR